jgi:PAS domain S-box-containing protein
VSGPPDVRFYAGAPIVTDDGHALGTVCVVDLQARQLTDTQIDGLRHLSALVVTLLEHERLRREEVARDIDATLESNERLTAMATAGLDPQAYIDRDGIYRHVNQTYLDYNACRAEDVIGQHVSTQVGDELYRTLVGRQIKRALQGEPVFYQRLADYKGRGMRHVEVALLPVRQANGDIAGVVMRAHDIEALKQNEVRLACTVDLLERKTREQQRFIHMLSHDLREPVNGINNFATLLQEDHERDLPPPARHYLGFVRQGGQRLNRLIDNLTEFAGLDSHTLQLQTVDVAHLAGQAREAMAPTLAATGGRIDIGPLPVLTADPALLHLVMMNLLGNALKFVRPGVAPDVRIDATQEDGHHQIRVCDNGVGIATERQHAIFGMFNRLHNRRQYDGTGLGLAICQRVADLHQGRLTVDSVPGQGSCFTLYLPTQAVGPH